MSYVSTWNPDAALSTREMRLAKHLKRTGKFFIFLREVRHRLFDDATQVALCALYDTETKEGRPSLPPAMLATVVLMQAYDQASDAVAVQNTVLDRRWQLVLDCLDAEDEEPLFSQGALSDFRRRLIEADLDGLLVERTVALAKETGLFGASQLRLALDSAPLWGAGRVEDTFNLIGHAMTLVARCAAAIVEQDMSVVLADADVRLLGKGSVKAALDVDWADDDAKARAFRTLLEDADRLQTWVGKNLVTHAQQPPLKEALEVLRQVIAQDSEPDPSGSGSRIKRGVAKDRRISITDPDMRHGRKSASKVINGYKRHILTSVDTGIIVEVDVRPANRPEHEVLDTLELPGVAELHIDRGFLGSPNVQTLRERGTEVISKAWSQHRPGKFGKRHFTFDLDAQLVTCPNGEQRPMRPGTICFPAKVCAVCPKRSACVDDTNKTGRHVHVRDDEAFHEELRARSRTPEGRERLRERVSVEHRLAHVCRRQGPRARYRGQRKNLFDLRRIAAVENLHMVAAAEAA